MLKAKAAIDGKTVYLFGLSFLNLDRLRADQPIRFCGAELGLSGDVIIFAGETEQAMADRLIGPETVVHIDPGRKV